MTDHDATHHADTAADGGEPQAKAQRVSRRTMLRGTAAAAAAAVAATALAGMAAPAMASASTRADERALLDGDADEVVVHVTNARAGEIDVFRGTSHVRITDRALAARLVRASR